MYDLNRAADSPVTIFSESPQDVNPAGEFRDRLERLTPHVFVTPTILAINVIVFVLMIVSGVSPVDPTQDSLIAWGANFGPSTATGGEWWRLLTCAFLHIGFIHLGFNMYVLVQIGAFVERLLGNIGFLIVYLICAVAGSMVSLAWNPFTVSAGASGAIFGLYGALLGFICIRRDTIPSEVLSGLVKSAVVFIGYNAVFGIVHSGTDLAAHAGGLGAGLLCGLGMSSPLTADYVRHRLTRAAGLAVAAAGLAAVAAVRLPHPPDLRAEIRKFADIEKKTLAAFNADLNRARTEKMRDEQLADLVNRDVIPQWAAERDAIAKLAGQQLHVKQKVLLGRVLEYMETRQRGWTMLVQALRAHKVKEIRDAIGWQQAADRLAKNMAGAAKTQPHRACAGSSVGQTR